MVRPVRRLTILGGGPAGLALAFYAHRAGVPFLLLEASPELGGMCRTFQLGDHRYDCGAHRFHDRDPEITADVSELLGDSLSRVDAPSAVCDRGRFIEFPPTPLNALFAYGPRDAGRIGFDLARAWRLRRAPARSFEELAVGRFGETLARRILLDYSAKLWGLPADRLSPDVATRRLQGMTLRSLMRELVSRDRRTAHLDGSFLYPRKGYGEIVDALARTLPRGSVRTRCPVVALGCDAEGIRRVQCSEGQTFENPGRVVSTLPLPVLVRLLGDALPDDARGAAARLRFRQLRLVFLRLRRPKLTEYASIYIPAPTYCVSRISEPRNRSIEMAPDGETSVLAEVPCFPEDALGRIPDADLAARIVTELEALGLLNPSDVLEWRHHRIYNAYPVYGIDYGRDVRAIESSLARIGSLDTLGRAGRFVYSHLHDQLRFGKDYVRTRFASAQASPAGAALESDSPVDRSPLPLANLPRLAKRLLHAAVATPLEPGEDAWVASILTPAEHALWSRLPPYDRRHAVDAAKRLQRRLAPTPYRDDSRWLSAALMHDVGKLQSGLSLRERSVAILASKAIGISTARQWARRGAGLRRRIGSYLVHGEVGAEMIRAAGGREEVAAWSEVHQGDREIGGLDIPVVVVEALIEADVG